MRLFSRPFRAPWFDQLICHQFFIYLSIDLVRESDSEKNPYEYFIQLLLAFRYFLLYKIRNPWVGINFKCFPTDGISHGEIHSQIHDFFWHSILWYSWRFVSKIWKFESNSNLSHLLSVFQWSKQLLRSSPSQDRELKRSPTAGTSAIFCKPTFSSKKRRASNHSRTKTATLRILVPSK